MSAVELETNDADVSAYATTILVESHALPARGIKVEYLPGNGLVEDPWVFYAYRGDTRIRLTFEHADQAVRAAARFIRLDLDVKKAEADRSAAVEQFFEDLGQTGGE